MKHCIFLFAIMTLISIPAYAEATPPNAIRASWKLVKRAGQKFKVPHLKDFPDPKISNAVNASIDEDTKDLRCDSESPEEFAKREFDVKIAVDYDQRNIFSVYATMGYYCGGPYPTNDEPFSMTYDLNTGKKIAFEELFKAYQENQEAILRIIFESQIKRAEGYDKEKDDGSCEHTDVFAIENLVGDSDSKVYDFTFTPKGLHVQPVWAHVSEACAERVSVPYEKLKEFAAPGSILDRVIRNSQN